MNGPLPPGHRYSGTIEDMWSLPFYWWQDAQGERQFIPDLLALAELEQLMREEFNNEILPEPGG